MKTLTACSRVRAVVLTTLASATAVAGARADDLSNLDLQSLMQMDITLVTAQRRVENVDRVPIAMTVLKPSAIASGADSTSDLQSLVPGLTTLGGASLITPFIRGVGTDVSSSGIEPSVATYVDGIYQGDRAQTFVDLANVEQVDVLRGPQGTLYGRNATGGAINITTRGPSDTLVARTEATAGNLNLRDASLFVAGPVAESLKVSLSAHVRDMDGRTTNIATGKKVNDESFYSLYGRAQFDITPALRAETLLKYFSRDNTGAYAAEISGNSIPALLGYQVGTRPDQIASDATDLPNRIDHTTAALKLNWDSAWAHVQSISSRQDQRHRLGADFDASTATFANYYVQDEYAAFTQELQVTPAQPHARLDWLLGAFYLDSTAGMSPVATATTAPGIGVITQLLTGEIATEAYAAFGEATYALTSALSVTGGLRYSSEQQRLDKVTAGIAGLPLMSFPSRQDNWDDLSYRLIAKYTLDDTFLYAKTESGFKSGAFNNGSALNPGPIDPEQITAYELGVKSTFPESGVRTSAAVFYNDYRHLQIQVIDSTTRESLLVQAPRAETYGAEASAEWKVTERWSVNAAASWLHAVYREFRSSDLLAPSPYGANAPVANLDLAGKRLSRSPEFSGNIGASYAYPLIAGELVSSANYYRTSRIDFYPTNEYSQSPYGVLNAAIQYRARAGWEVSVWGKNLTNEDYLMMVVPNQITTDAEYSLPRTYGLSVSYGFAQ